MAIERFVRALHFDCCLAYEFGWDALWAFDAGITKQHVGIGIEWMRAAIGLSEIYAPLRVQRSLMRTRGARH